MDINQLSAAVANLKADELAVVLKKSTGGLKRIREILDMWDDPDEFLSKEQIGLGPVESASGEGLDRMLDRYSHPQKQEGIALAYDKLATRLDRMEKAMSGLLLTMGKAEEKEEEEEEEKEREESAKSLAEKVASEVLRRMGKAEDKEEEEDEKEMEKALRIIAQKAVENGNTTEFMAAMKAISAIKAEARDESENMMEDEDTNQADRAADARKAKEEDKDDLGKSRIKALEKSLAMTTLELDKLRQTIMNASTGNPTAPVIPASVRGNGDVSPIAKARADHDAGLLEMGALEEVESLMQMKGYVDNGQLPASVFERKLESASMGARRCFEGE